MARINLSLEAAKSVRALPKDRALLGAIWRHIEEAADDPKHIKPPAFPYRWPMLNFPAYDSSKQMWAVTVLVEPGKIDADGRFLNVILIHAAPFLAGLDPDDFFT